MVKVKRDVVQYHSDNRPENLVPLCPNHHEMLHSNKYGLWDWALNNKFRHYVLGLTGWKWWFYQIVVCGIFFILIELLLNLIGLTMLPWK